MQCQEKDCGGQVNLGNWIYLLTGCRSSNQAFACVKCGRLHWRNGSAVVNRQGQKAFLVDNIVVNR